MIKYCIDTNAILDLCYRYYPSSIFSNIWDMLESSVLSRQIKIIISQHIHEEVYDRATLMSYDKTILDNFLRKFQVDIISKKEYEEELAQLQAELLNITPLKSSIAKNTDDLSNICVAQKESATIITAEQGSPLNITDKQYKRLKIPDTCRHYKLGCQNWIPMFEYIGV